MPSTWDDWIKIFTNIHAIIEKKMFDLLYSHRMRRYWFYVKNQFPTSEQNCENNSIFCVFEKNFLGKSKIPVPVSDSAHNFLLIILIIFFDETEIR